MGGGAVEAAGTRAGVGVGEVVDFRTMNAVWASVAIETLRRLGLEVAVISPGSRSAPLAIALTQDSRIETIPVLEERSAAFFALGIAKRTHVPVVLACSSGTAGAHYYPALIEARESCVPLLVFTADRPPELRDCHSGQTIDQNGLYGRYPNWQAELATPSLELGQLRYLRQTIVQAWRRALHPSPGPVHLNIPFRDPLAPIPDNSAASLATQFPANFFDGIVPWTPPRLSVADSAELPIARWRSCTRGAIIAGPAQPASPERYCRAIARIARALGWPVLAEGLSPLRNYADLVPSLVAHYDTILRNPQAATALRPELVLQLGPLPTSKELRNWLAACDPMSWQVEGGDRNLDPLHNRTIPLPISVEQLSEGLSEGLQKSSDYLDLWLEGDRQIGAAIDRTLRSLDRLCESKVAWMLAQTLPARTPLFIANSTPVRDVEWFWRPGRSRVQPYVNRGANGIDGTLSTALGLAHRHRSSVLLTGDLALLHDTNGLLSAKRLDGHLTIVVANNNGGGIFNLLPIAQFEPPFEDYFATPQNIPLDRLCHTYGIEHRGIATWEEFKLALKTLPQTGVRLLELQTNRQLDAAWRLEQFRRWSGELDLTF
ncbi:2-succinyl-5-enolpyruvyl-6-hydroxy-3-cyclohexene-1-carboxylic-acid synthase [Synechococcus sp. PCC 7336]|uniref:2-succinyl-5-enolpyruvyl-6-hydroxy-3- cyclohexene-1-carboxylic-acid synthase n=1 Tax=Synechococcus sp. PCC 7336 TaxID=195250 RepID=UPI0006863986|nr:2-succinyl-5-enolpyruvyl-6-hydroxy-3-cyclohexene-1-carboxylic-acid synthase [Synechococcus sp. PCC 7336]